MTRVGTLLWDNRSERKTTYLRYCTLPYGRKSLGMCPYETFNATRVPWLPLLTPALPVILTVPLGNLNSWLGVNCQATIRFCWK